MAFLPILILFTGSMITWFSRKRHERVLWALNSGTALLVWLVCLILVMNIPNVTSLSVWRPSELFASRLELHLDFNRMAVPIWSGDGRRIGCFHRGFSSRCSHSRYEITPAFLCCGCDDRHARWELTYRRYDLDFNGRLDGNISAEDAGGHEINFQVNDPLGRRCGWGSPGPFSGYDKWS